ncbi:MAG: hypothetical protein ABI047_14850, partial [Jatrophihabitantaceae bacterium]
MASSADTGANGTGESPDDEAHPSRDGLPDAVTGQSCAFCGGPNVVWVHPLATDRVQFRKFGKDDTVPSFWTLCEGCEQLYQDGEDDQLIASMKLAGGWIWQ